MLISTTMFLHLIHNIFHLINPTETLSHFQNSHSPSYIWLYESINKNFEAFKQFYLSLNLNFSIVCFSEIWASDININKNSSFQFPNYNTEHRIRKSGKGGVVCIFIHDSLDYKARKDLFTTFDAIESLSIEICKRKTRNTVFNVVYRSPNGDKNQRIVL